MLYRKVIKKGDGPDQGTSIFFVEHQKLRCVESGLCPLVLLVPSFVKYL